MGGSSVAHGALRVRVDQDQCTGDGLCAQYAPDVFELDIDGLAYVKGDDGDLRSDSGATVAVPAHLVLRVIDSAEECPGDCIYVTDAAGSSIAGPVDGVAAALAGVSASG